MAVKKDLSIEYLGVKCENPFFLSSSPVGSNYEMVAKAFETGWGGVFFKTVGIFVADECSPRFDQNDKNGLPWVGFKNMEQISDKPTEVNFENIYKLKRDYPDKIMVSSIMGSTEEEWRELAKMSEQAEADLIECNFSCPQMTSHAMGSDVGTNLELVEKYSRAVAESTKLPVIAKMTPNITIMEPAAIAAIKGGAKGVSAINTVKSITSLDYENLTGMPVVNGVSSISGYSGTAVKPIGLRFIANLAQCKELEGVPLSGIGGIETWNDALDYILVGARNVQVTTSVMQYGYRIVEDMISGLSYFMDERGFDSVDELVGLALPNLVPAEELNRDFKIIPKIDLDKCVGCGRCYVSCYDAAHQAIDWDDKKRRPTINDNCVGCHLCLNVCPVKDCILPGEIEWKEGRTPTEIKVKHYYD
ncbi:MAG: NAD-dependent dihydropyrimidine dehydrogenase subunit PreA [Clostridiales bacterium]|jgi:dihydropyrimidine dehydrogenase (NAD+) subunit PreA|nr:NAD-dependent dihydropyrimidine dehydrogenase subunit PreA [Clostridiales bacterium]